MRGAFRRRPVLSNYERNMQRIMHPPKPTLRDQFWGACWWLQRQWCRHVTQRELHRRLDGARLLVGAARPPEWDAPEFTERSLQRLAADFNRWQQSEATSTHGPLPGPGERGGS